MAALIPRIESTEVGITVTDCCSVPMANVVTTYHCSQASCNVSVTGWRNTWKQWAGTHPLYGLTIRHIYVSYQQCHNIYYIAYGIIPGITLGNVGLQAMGPHPLYELTIRHIYVSYQQCHSMVVGVQTNISYVRLKTIKSINYMGSQFVSPCYMIPTIICYHQ